MKKIFISFGIISLLTGLVLFFLYRNHKESDMQEKQLNTEEIIKSDFLDLSGDYVSSTGEKATVTKNNQNWRISYNTDEGNVLEIFLRIGRKMATIGILLQNLISQTEIRILKYLFQLIM